MLPIHINADSTYLENDKLQFCDVVRVNPVLGGLTHEAGLVPTSSTVTLGRVTSGSHEIIQFRELDDEGVVVVPEEWLCIQTCGKNRLESPSSLFLEYSS